MKIFSFNHNNFGTFRDSITGILGTPSGGSFKKTLKGYSYYLESGDSISYTGLSFDLIDLITECRGIGTLRITIGATNNDIVLTDNQWSFEKDTFALTSQTTVTITVTSGFAYVSRIFGFDHSLSTLEENNLQIDFLRNKGTGSSIHKNGFPIKADDLSHVDGLVAAYNMIPSSSGIVVNTQGNSAYNGTINGAISTKNGMAFKNANIDITVLSEIAITSDYSVSFRFKANDVTTAQHIISSTTGMTNRNVFGLQGGTIRIGNFNNVAFQGNQSNAVSINQWYIITYTWNSVTLTGSGYINGIPFSGIAGPSSLFPNVATKLGSATNDSLYFNGELADVRFYSRILTTQEIKNYHNQFVKPVILEDFSSEAVELVPREWIVDSGTFLTYEDTTGNKYAQCDSNSVSKILYKDTLLGTVSIDYYNGSVWVTVTDTLENLISTYAWLSHDGQYLIFTLTSGDRIDNIKITNGIKQF